MKNLEFALVLKGEASGAKAAVQEVKAGLGAVSVEAGQAAAALDKHAATLDKDAAAAKRAADAQRDLAAAEKAAREEAARTTGAAPARAPLAVVPPAQRPAPPSPQIPSTSSPQGPLPSGPGAGGPAGADLDALRERYVPIVKVQREYREELAMIAQTQQAGALTEQESAAAISHTRTAYERQVEMIERTTAQLDKSGRGIKLTANEYRNLTFQANDLFQSLALGMPVSQVLLQQGPQITQIYGGVGNTFRALTSVLTPMRVGLGLTAAAVAVGAAAFDGYLTSIKEVETAASGLGRATAGTAGDMEAAAQAGAAAAGISIKAARAMEAQFLRTGKIGAQNFEALIGVSKDFAATIGIDADQSGAALSEMFADPGKAAMTLYRQYGLIDGATAEYATRLAAQNRLTEAQSVLIDALPDRLADAAQATTALGRAWDFVDTTSGNALDAIGDGINRLADGPGLAEQIADAQKAYDRLSRMDPSSSPGRAGTYGQRAQVAGEKLRALQAEQARIDAEAERKSKLEQDRQAGAVASGYADQSPATEEARRRRALEDQAAALQRGAAADDLGADQRSDIAAALDAKSRALATLLPQQEKARQLDAIDARLQTELNPLIRANLAAERQRVSLAGEEVTAGAAQARISDARAKALADEIGAIENLTGQTAAEVAARKSMNDAVASGALSAGEAEDRLRAEIQLRPLAAAAAAAQGEEQKRLNAVLEEARAVQIGLAEQDRRAGAQDLITGQEEKLAQLRLEKQLIGQNATIQARAMAQLQAEQDIRRRGLDALDAQAVAIRKNADAQAVLNSEIEKQTAAWDKVKTSGENTIDSLVDAMSSGDFKGAAESIGKDITATLTELTIKNPLKNLLLGTDKETAGDLGGLGGIIGKLFGAKGGDAASSALGQSVGAMTVTAGTVVVNGGVAGNPAAALGSVLGAANDNKTFAAPVGAVTRAPLGEIGAAAKDAGALGFVGNYRSGVDARLTDILTTAAKQFPGYKVDAISGFRSGDPRYHGKGMATDVQLTDLASGRKLGNYQDAASFGQYERFAQTARQVQMDKYPELADRFRWGGYFGGAKGKYGALDTMHFDTGGKAMAGGSWATGLTSAQKSLWPGIESSGAKAVEQVDKLAAASGEATKGLDIFGGGVGEMGKTLAGAPGAAAGSGGAGGGGLFGWLGNLFGGSSGLGAGGGFGGSGKFASGGYTGPGHRDQPAGVVHAGEVVWSQRDVARAGGVATVEAMRLGSRGYAQGGVAASGAPMPSFGSAGGRAWAQDEDRAPRIVINNLSSTKVEHEEQEGPRGQRQQVFTISDAVDTALTTRGGAANRTLRKSYGLKPATVRR